MPSAMYDFYGGVLLGNSLQWLVLCIQRQELRWFPCPPLHGGGVKERERETSTSGMRGRCSTSRHGSRSMEAGRPKLIEEPHLSGAYIRCLVKQLSSSMPKGPMNPKSLDGAAGDGEPLNNLPRLGEGSSEAQQEQQQQQQQEKATPPRKQTRRRVHTSRPYQERLINMAEARREIVTALKIHRAAMKRASELQQQQQKTLQQEKLLLVPPPPLPLQELQKEMIGRENPGVSPSDNLSMLFSYFKNPSLPSAPYSPNSLPHGSISPLPILENPSFAFPSRPLGLNLNLQDFNNIDINLYNNSTNPPLLSSTSSTSSPSTCSHSFASPMTTTPPPGFPSVSDVPLQTSEATSKPAVGTLHPTMGDEEMAEIQSIGEQHDMEWNDKLNLVTSAWWCKLLKTVEASPQAHETRNGGEGIVGHGLGLFDQVIDIPSWLNDQQQVDDHYYYSDQYLKDASLPCLDIGDIEGTDCGWL